MVLIRRSLTHCLCWDCTGLPIREKSCRASWGVWLWRSVGPYWHTKKTNVWDSRHCLMRLPKLYSTLFKELVGLYLQMGLVWYYAYLKLLWVNVNHNNYLVIVLVFGYMHNTVHWMNLKLIVMIIYWVLENAELARPERVRQFKLYIRELESK
jgi:hypothetical protein